MSGAWGHSFLVVQPPGPIETDLVTLEELKLELGITGTTEDAALQGRITRLSEQIAEYCDRVFALLEVEETFQFYNGARCPCGGPQPAPLVLTQYPIVSITLLTRDGTDITSDQYDLDSASGLLWPLNGTWSGRIVAHYTGGYDLPDDAPATLQSAVIESVRLRRAFSASDPTVREVGHGDARVGFNSEPLNSSAGFSQSVAQSLDTFRRQYV